MWHTMKTAIWSNHRPALGAAVAFCLHSGAHWRRASEAGC